MRVPSSNALFRLTIIILLKRGTETIYHRKLCSKEQKRSIKFHPDINGRYWSDSTNTTTSQWIIKQKRECLLIYENGLYAPPSLQCDYSINQNHTMGFSFFISSSNSWEWEFFQPRTFLPNSTTAICRPRQTPIKKKEEKWDGYRVCFHHPRMKTTDGTVPQVKNDHEHVLSIYSS